MMNLMYYHKKKTELRLHLNRDPADPSEVARSTQAHVRTNFVKSALLSRQNEVEDPNSQAG